jgi:uncharacterized membrane protein
MKDLLRKLFSPLLNPLEMGEEKYSYKKSHRVALVGVGSLFLALSTSTILIGLYNSQIAALFPGTVFLAASIFCLVVGALGNDRAVSKLWRNK